MELQDEFSTYSLGVEGEEGSYRRPLDPEHIGERFADAMGWRPFGQGGAAIGRVRVMSSNRDHALSDYDLSYPGSPYVVMDTAGTDLGRTEVELEGGFGRQVGRLGFGLALGYRAHHTRTREAPAPRSLSVAAPGASLGVVWEFSPRLTLGAHGRWRAHAERVTLYTVAASTRVYRLQGFFEPPPQDLAGGYYSRRLEREGFSEGVSAGGTIAGVEWVAFAELGAQEERQHATGPNPDADTWNSDAATVGGGATRRLPFRNARFSVSGRYTTLSGNASRGDLPDTTTFVTNESVLHAEGELSLEHSENLLLMARMVVRYEDRVRNDQLADVKSPIQSWTTGFGFAARFRLMDRLALSAAAARSWYGAGGGMPDPRELGKAYGLFVAPEMALNASDARISAGSLGARWSLGDRAGFWGRVVYSSLSPPSGQAVSIASQPGGNRQRWSMAVGVTVLDGLSGLN